MKRSGQIKPYIPTHAYYLQTQIGFERIAWSETQARVPEAALSGYKTVPTKSGITLLTLEEGPEPLLDLRTAEDVFATIHQCQIDWGYQGFSQVYELMLRTEPLMHAISVFERLTGKHHGRQATFRLVTRLVGAQQPYRRMDLEKSIAKAIKAGTKGAWRLGGEDADIEIWANLMSRDFVCGLRLSDASMRHRDYKELHIPASLRPSVAAALAWVAKPDPGDILLDPLCGAGTVLIERGMMGPHRLLLGGDLDPVAIAAAAANIGRKHKPRQLFEWNAERLPLQDESVNKIVSNLPFGKTIGKPSELPRQYRRMMDEFARVLTPAGRCVLLTSQDQLLRRAIAEGGALRIGSAHPVEILGQRAQVYTVTHRRRSSESGPEAE
jgi:23S rRNA G2445 N2-methylase RlmL